MPRKARKGQKASKEKVQAIKAEVAAVEQGMSIRGVAKQFGIPYTTNFTCSRINPFPALIKSKAITGGVLLFRVF